jgi:cytochrome P450
VNTAFANLVNFVLDHRDYVVEVIRLRLGCSNRDRAIRLGDLIERLSDRDVEILIKEILRLDPIGSLAFRLCIQNATIGGADVASNTVVCLVPGAAMIDDRVFPEPDTIRFDRPPEDYLHFCAGVHRCAGQTIEDPIVFPIALPMLRVMFRRLTRLPQLRRAAGAAGMKTQTYPLLTDGLTVRFRPHIPSGQ